MLFRIISIGTWGEGPERILFEKYRQRLPKGHLELVEIKNQASKAQEGTKILQKIHPESEVIAALDERGDLLSTRQFNQWLSSLESKVCAFIIGGADGLDPTVLEKANKKISLGPMTWPHFLVRVLLAEQLYRVQQIRLGHPYHRD